PGRRPRAGTPVGSKADLRYRERVSFSGSAAVLVEGGPMRNPGSSSGLCARFALGALLAAALVLLGPAPRASAQEGQGKFLTQATQRLIKLIAKANEDGFVLANNQFSIGGGWL